MITEIINEMALSDGLVDLETRLQTQTARLSFYSRYASAALRAVRRVQGDSVPCL
jgi:hypothetical protein